jgi:Domain of unknown function (DUF4383)
MQLRLFPHQRTTDPDRAGAVDTFSAPESHAEPSSVRPSTAAELPETAPPATPTQDVESPPGEGPIHNTRVLTVHRVGAVAVALVILTFGVLGFAGGLDFFSTSGGPVLGMSSNGLLSTISVLTAAVLMAAAARGPRIASTVMIVVGTMFLVSALANLALLRTSFNPLAFELSNVAFSVVAGLVLLLLGAYGRLSGNLPADSPYARSGIGATVEPPESFPSTAAEFAAERAMRNAEVAVVNHVATADQRRRVIAMAQVRTRLDRRRVWMSFDGQ